MYNILILHYIQINSNFNKQLIIHYFEHASTRICEIENSSKLKIIQIETYLQI